MNKLYLLTIALLIKAGHAFAMQTRDLNLPDDERPAVLHPIRMQRFNPHNNFKKQILAMLDKENDTAIDLTTAYNSFNLWIGLFTNTLNPQNLKTELKSLQTTYSIFARALSRDATQQTNLTQLQQNIENVGHLVNGSISVITSGNAANNNNNLK
jgi:hypothetical protein